MDKHFERLSAYLDGELNGQDAREVENLIANDAEWAAEKARLEETREIVAGAAPPSTAHDRVAQQIAAEAQTRGRNVLRYAAAAAVLLIGVAGASYYAFQAVPTTGEESRVELPGEQASPAQVASEAAVESNEPAVPGPQRVVPRAEVEQTIEVSGLPVELLGVYTDRNGVYAYIEFNDDGRRESFQEGDEVLPDVVLSEIVDADEMMEGLFRSWDYNFEVRLAREDSPDADPTTLESRLRVHPFDLPGWEAWEYTLVLQGDSISSAALVSWTGNRFLFETGGKAKDGLGDHGEVDGGEVRLRTPFGIGSASIELLGTINGPRTAFVASGPVNGTETHPVFEITARRTDDAVLDAVRTRFKYEERYEVARDLSARVIEYRNTHDNRYPDSLADFMSRDIRSRVGKLWLYPDRLIVEPGKRYPQDEAPGWATWDSWYPNLPVADRYVLMEQALLERREKHAEDIVVRIEYDDPETVFVVDAWGELRAKTLPDGAIADHGAATNASCQNNMKQLGLVCKMFEHESYGEANYFPPGWEITYPEYLADRRVLTCPKDPPGAISYELLFPATDIDSFAKYAAVELEFLTAEELESNAFTQDRRPDGSIGTGSPAALALGRLPVILENHPHRRENGVVGYNVCFADGHVQFVTEDKLDEVVGPYLALR